MIPNEEGTPNSVIEETKESFFIYFVTFLSTEYKNKI